MRYTRSITHHWSIQRKLQVGFMLSLLVTTAVSVVVTVRSTNQALETRVRNVELPAIVSTAKADIRRHVSGPLTSAMDLAANHYILTWESNGQPIEGLQDFLAYTSRLKVKYGASSVYWVSAFNRVYLTDSGSLGPLKPESDWFDKFMSDGKEYSLDLGQDTSSATLTLFVNARFTGRTGHAGLAGIGLPMTSLAKQIAEYRVGDSGSVMLVSADGTVLVDKDAALADGKHRLADLPGFSATTASRLMSRDASFTFATYQTGANETIAVSTFIPELDVYVVAKAPTSELVGAVRRAAWTGPLLAAALSLLLASFMIAILARAVANPVRRAATMLSEISNGHGDLTRRMPVESGDEIGQLAIAFNRFIESLHSMVSQVRDSSMHVARAASELASGSLDLSHRTDRASSALQHTVLTMKGITGQVQQNANIVASVAQLARSAHTVVGHGDEAVGEIDQIMSSIVQSSRSVEEVISIIDHIALQTNMLSLNASVESAHAGVHGRGFAVVAGEVRALARRAAESAKEVRLLVSQARLDAQAGQAQTSATKETMQQVLRSVSELSGFVGSIDESIRKQRAGIQEVGTAVTQVNETTQQNVCLVEEFSVTAETLRKHAEVLAEAVSKFKLA